VRRPSRWRRNALQQRIKNVCQINGSGQPAKLRVAGSDHAGVAKFFKEIARVPQAPVSVTPLWGNGRGNIKPKLQARKRSRANGLACVRRKKQRTEALLWPMKITGNLYALAPLRQSRVEPKAINNGA